MTAPDRPSPALRTEALEQLLVERGLADPAVMDTFIRTYEQDVGPLNGAKVVARAWTDPEYEAWLLADGTAAEIKAKAGVRRISFALDGDIDEAALRALPFLTTLDVHGQTVRIRSSDADATVHALYGLGLYPRNLEVAGLGLEQAFVALTEAEEEARQW